MADGPVQWGKPVRHGAPGVYIIELAAPQPSPALDLSTVGKWLERVPELELDGARPVSKELQARLGRFWLPSQPIVFIGSTPGSLAGRVAAIVKTIPGDRKPAASGFWLHFLRAMPDLRVWWAATTAVEEYEDALLTAFGDGVSAAERAALPDHDVVLPFANLRTPTGTRKQTGLTGSIRAEPVTVSPPTRVVELPDGDADGARGEPPARKPRTTSKTAPRRTVAPKVETTLKSPEQQQLTTEGAARLREELRTLTEVRRPEVVARIRSAKELGDLKENADYHAAREEQSFLEGRIQTIEAVLRGAEVVDAPAAGSAIGLGSTVTVESDGDEVTYVLVSSSEASPKDGRISVASPVGRALLGRGAGDEVVVKTPQGEARYRVISIG